MTEEDFEGRYATLLIEPDGPLTWITFNRPQSLNAFSDELLVELSEALEVLAHDESVHVIALRGGGRAFSTGFDLDPEGGELDEGATRSPVADLRRRTSRITRFLEIWDHPKPIIAAVHGYCLAGAAQMCVFCDLTIVSEDVTVGWPALPIGGGYLSPVWEPLVGAKRAKQMSFLPGSRIDAQTAVAWGWANYAVPAESLYDEIRALAGEMAKVPSELLELKKLAINRAADVQGFRTVVGLGAETNALAHQLPAVRSLAELIGEHGLREAIRKFRDDSDSGDEKQEE